MPKDGHIGRITPGWGLPRFWLGLGLFVVRLVRDQVSKLKSNDIYIYTLCIYLFAVCLLSWSGWSSVI